MKILLIEDDEVIAERIQNGLQKAMLTVDVALDGETGFQMARTGGYGLIILDVMLPRRDGWSISEALRLRKDPVPILMLTARDALEDRVKGLDGGADDYLVKPFQFPELLARVRALMRRTTAAKKEFIQISDLEIDCLSRSVRRGGRSIHLTPHEYSLLEALARNEGRTLSRDFIRDRVWGDDDSFSNTVSFHVALLRRKVDSEFSERLIHTVHGVGYVLRAPETPR